MQFSIISFGVVLNYDYFKEDFLKHVVYVILVIILLGLIVDPSFHNTELKTPLSVIVMDVSSQNS